MYQTPCTSHAYYIYTYQMTPILREKAVRILDKRIKLRKHKIYTSACVKLNCSSELLKLVISVMGIVNKLSTQHTVNINT